MTDTTFNSFLKYENGKLRIYMPYLVTIDQNRTVNYKICDFDDVTGGRNYRFLRFKFIVVGAGGTGGYVIPGLVQMINSFLKTQDQTNPPMSCFLHIVDPDIVEEKNILRQNFIYNDIGKPKAEVLAERYSIASGFPISAHVCKFEDINFVDSSRNELDIGYSYGDFMVIIDATDNLTVRNSIISLIESVYDSSYVLLISSGNDEKEGQIILTGPKLGLPRSMKTIWPELFTEESLLREAEELARVSCAENAVSKPQSIAINRTAANMILNILYLIMFDLREIFYTYGLKGSFIDNLSKMEFVNLMSIAQMPMDYLGSLLEYDVYYFNRFGETRRFKINEPVFLTSEAEKQRLAQLNSQPKTTLQSILSNMSSQAMQNIAASVT